MVKETGSTVYVRWYRDILQGEVVENERNDQLVGMVAVRISVQGVRITALFHPQHVYQSEDEAKGNSPIISSNSPKVTTEEREISREIQKSTEIICEKIQDSSKNICSKPEADAVITQLETNDPVIASSDGWEMLQKFKAEHWDHEHNHLRIDALDEFYQLWKSLTSPILMVQNTDRETINKLAEEYVNYDSVLLCLEDSKPSHYLVSDERMEQLKSQLKQSLKPQQKTVQLDLFS